MPKIENSAQQCYGPKTKFAYFYLKTEMMIV